MRRDLKIQHRGTALGALWSLITPITTVAIYTFIFTVIMPASPVRDAGDVPFAVYLFVGLTIWNLFQNGLIAGTSSVVGSGYLLSKVYFRREILPLTSVISALVTFCWEFGVAFLRHAGLRRHPELADRLPAPDRARRRDPRLRPGPAPVDRGRLLP